MPPFHKQSGFTLIELLVVIAIISLLSSVILSALGGARENARDSVRVQDFDQLRTALEMYYSEFGKYPCGDCGPYCTSDGSADSSLSDGFISGVEITRSWCQTDLGGLDDVGAYPEKTRTDPVNERYTYFYTYYVTSGRTNYVLYVPLESSSRAAEDGGLCDNYYEAGSGVGEISPIMLNAHGIPCN